MTILIAGIWSQMFTVPTVIFVLMDRRSAAALVSSCWISRRGS